MSARAAVAACRLLRIEGKLLQQPTGEERRKPFHFPLDGRRKEGERQMKAADLVAVARVMVPPSLPLALKH